MATPTRSVAPTAPHNHTIIFLHGRGSNDILAGIKWVFPTATESYDQSEDESQSFDMSSVQRPQENSEIQRSGLWHSVAQVLQVVKTETDIVGSQNVMLAGISQGCAIGIFALLASGMQIGGFIGLSGWLPLAEEVQGIINVPGRARDVLRTPVLLQHCKDDDVVPVENGNDLRIRLEEIGMCVRWECFEEGGHCLNEPNGMDGLVDFIQAIMEAT